MGAAALVRVEQDDFVGLPACVDGVTREWPLSGGHEIDFPNG